MYQLSKKKRDKYLEDEQGNIKISILSQMCSAYFINGDIMPSKITIRINVKNLIRQINEYRKEYPESKLPFWGYASYYIQQVLQDLELEYTAINVVSQHNFDFVYEVSFSKDTITNI